MVRYNQLKDKNILVLQISCIFFLKGNIAVTPQEPWVINDTVKNNILFGKNCDKRRFQQTLKYCCLNEDVKEDTIINGKVSLRKPARWSSG